MNSRKILEIPHCGTMKNILTWNKTSSLAWSLKWWSWPSKAACNAVFNRDAIRLCSLNHKTWKDSNVGWDITRPSPATKSSGSSPSFMSENKIWTSQFWEITVLTWIFILSRINSRNHYKMQIGNNASTSGLEVNVIRRKCFQM